MSKARRDTNCLRCSIFWNGQANSPVQRARDALLARRRLLAHHVGVQRARALLREVKLLRALRPLVEHDVDHLRDDVAGALDHDGVADPDVAALAHTSPLLPMPLM